MEVQFKFVGKIMVYYVGWLILSWHVLITHTTSKSESTNFQ